MLLAGCATAPPSPAPTLIVNGCPVVVPCHLPATAPTINGQLLSDQERTELAWAECAAQVDSVYQYQVTHEQAR
ncbi:Rz1-like lysis system protein LysC [Pseudomonas aeruginosa]|uniref:Rz1-like lysis system protein LysC n=2 Tax=Pseudomonas TaxID=286 RepID=UPI003D9E8728